MKKKAKKPIKCKKKTKKKVIKKTEEGYPVFCSRCLKKVYLPEELDIYGKLNYYCEECILERKIKN